MAEKRSILFQLLGDSRGLERATRAGETSLDRLKGAFGKVAAVAGVAFGAQQVVNYVGDALSLASAAEEVDSKFQAVYGSAEALEGRLSALGDKAGITDANVKGLAATFGNLAQSQDITGEELEGLVGDVAELAGDLASFNDQDPARVFDNMTKAILTTEREGMKSLGISVSENEVKQRALAKAMEDGRTEVTKADRAWASYAIIVDQAGKAVGDLDRTSDSAANRQRQLRATLEEVQTEIGQELLPVMADLLDIVSDLTPVIKGAAGGLTAMVDPVARLTGAIADADEEGKRWWQTLGEMTEGAYRLIPGVGAAIDGFRDLTGGVEDADVTFQEFADTSAIIEDALVAVRGKYEDAAAAAASVADAQEEAERRVQASVDRWVGVLGNLQAAYDRTAAKAAATAFLAPGGGDDRGPDPFAPGGEFGGMDFGDAQEDFRRLNGSSGT